VVYGILNEHHLLAKRLRRFQLESRGLQSQTDFGLLFGHRRLDVGQHKQPTFHGFVFASRMMAEDVQINDAFATMQRAAKGKAKAIRHHSEQAISTFGTDAAYAARMLHVATRFSIYPGSKSIDR